MISKAIKTFFFFLRFSRSSYFLPLAERKSKSIQCGQGSVWMLRSISRNQFGFVQHFRSGAYRFPVPLLVRQVIDNFHQVHTSGKISLLFFFFIGNFNYRSWHSSGRSMRRSTVNDYTVLECVSNA